MARCVDCGKPHEAGRKYAHPERTMALPDGKTCDSCVYSTHCDALIGADRDTSQCDWYPIRFVERTACATIKSS